MVYHSIHMNIPMMSMASPLTFKQMAPVATFIPAMLALIASWHEEFMFFFVG